MSMIYRITFLIICCYLKTNLNAQQVITNKIGMEFIMVNPGAMLVGKFQPTVGKPPEQGKEAERINMLPPAAYVKAQSLAKQDAMEGFKVNITKTFYLGKYEVTQEQWQQVMHSNPSVFKNKSSSGHPVENISWKQAGLFIRKLNKLDKNYHYRLPTEFEWEYAARAGAPDDIPWTEIRKLAVLSGRETSKVGSMQPNRWGFYDMLGNVWEWVSDVYNEKIFADPTSPSSGKQHVLKGSSFTGDVKNATYMAHAGGPGNGFDVGFRLVMEIKENNAQK